jgi:copper chaperone CopZ
MKKSGTPGHRLLTRAQVAAIFQVSPSTITRWAEAGMLPVVKTLGGHRRYDATVVQSLAHQLAAATPPDTQNVLLSHEEANMTKTTIDVPAMYGDHHVLEVRNILAALPGVESVTASSCFHTVEVSFDPAQSSADDLEAALAAAGYVAPLQLPTESDTAITQIPEAERAANFRHTTAFEQTRAVVNFAHVVLPQDGTRHALWPCPGMGTLSHKIDPDAQTQEVNYA